MVVRRETVDEDAQIGIALVVVPERVRIGPHTDQGAHLRSLSLILVGDDESPMIGYDLETERSEMRRNDALRHRTHINHLSMDIVNIIVSHGTDQIVERQASLFGHVVGSMGIGKEGRNHANHLERESSARGIVCRPMIVYTPVTLDRQAQNVTRL